MIDSESSLADVFLLYGESQPESRRKKVISDLKTTLKKYILPQLISEKKVLSDFDNCLRRINIKHFATEADSTLKKASAYLVESGMNPGSIKNYRSKFRLLLKWMKSQDWYQEVVQPTTIPNCAPKMKANITIAQLHKGRKHSGAVPYGLKEKELTPYLCQQITQLHNYLTNDWLRTKRGDRPLKESTWKTSCYTKILEFLGWLKNVMGFDFSDLDITLITDKLFLDDYLNWHFTEKKNGYKNAISIATAALNVAKWHYESSSKRADFSDCEPILQIRENLCRLSAKESTDRRTTSKESLAEKLLEMEQCLEIVDFFRQCCALRENGGKLREIKAVIDSWQDYILAAILVFSPVRQKEIRELKIGVNLHRERDGWWVELSPDEHKTGLKTGKGRAYPLFPCHLKEQLTKHLDQYVNYWRPQEKLKHNFLFFRPGSNANPATRGQPIPDSRYFSTTVPNMFFRASAILYGEENAKSPSPHDFRRIYATWVCKYGNSEDLSICAELLGNSVEMLLKTYQQCQSRDTTERAQTSFLNVRSRSVEIKAQKENKVVIPVEKKYGNDL